MAENVHNNELHRIVMTAVVWREGSRGREYLVIKRSPTKKVFPNKWSVPGGGLEPGDYIGHPKTTEDAWYHVAERTLRREVKEEVDLEIEKPEYLHDLVFVRPDGVPVLTLVYHAKYKEGEVQLEEGDSTEYRWITLEEVDELDFLSGVGDDIRAADEALSKNSHSTVQ